MGKNNWKYFGASTGHPRRFWYSSQMKFEGFELLKNLMRFPCGLAFWYIGVYEDEIEVFEEYDYKIFDKIGESF